MWEFLDLCKPSCDGSGHSLEFSSSEADSAAESVHVTSEDSQQSGQKSHLTTVKSGDMHKERNNEQTFKGCEQDHEIIEKRSTEVQGSYTSNVSETPESVVQETPPAFYSSNTSTVPETPESVLLETSPGYNSTSISDYETYRSEDVFGFQIHPDEVPEFLRKATIEMAEKYFLA